MNPKIRALTEANIGAANGILQTSFGVSGSFAADLQSYLDLQPDGWFLAMLGSEPAGVVGAVDYGRFAYIGLMAVHPDAQGQGIGSTLLQHLLRWLDARGTSTALLDATEAGYPLYVKAGFVEQDRAELYSLHNHCPYKSYPDYVRPFRIGDLSELVKFDASVFGMRREVVLRTLLTESLDRTFVVEDGRGNLSGYVIAQPYRIGPWATCHPETAEALLQAALTVTYEGSPVIVAPGKSPAAELIERHGFHCTKTCRHMQRGSESPTKRSCMYGQVNFVIG